MHGLIRAQDTLTEMSQKQQRNTDDPFALETTTPYEQSKAVRKSIWSTINQTRALQCMGPSNLELTAREHCKRFPKVEQTTMLQP